MAELSLSELLTNVSMTLRREMALQGVWVKAELSDVRQSGVHCYMELIEKDMRGMTVAKVRATIWQSSLQRLRAKFMAATGRDIATGIKVLVNGSISHHNLYGLSFNITDIDPSYTLGDMERLRREILQRLEKEGVAKQNLSLAMPMAPQRIAIISASGAAGYGDFMEQLLNNPQSYKFYTHLFEAAVQSERTSPTVRAALKQIEMTIDLWDCVVIIRGGGSTTDLNGFDDYELARAVATFPLPVIVGIGHERDRTVLDEIANTRTKTPTAAAAFLIGRLDEAAARVAMLGDELQRYATASLKGASMQLEGLQTAVKAYAQNRLDTSRQRLAVIAQSVPALASGRLTVARQKLDSNAKLIDAFSHTRIRNAATALDTLGKQLSLLAPTRLQSAKSRLQAIEQMVEILSPNATLKRGYTMTLHDGHPITSASQLAAGQTIETRFADGTITSEIK